MLRHSYHPLVLTIIGLALLGLVVRFVESPTGFISSILMTIGIAALMFFLFKRFIIPRIIRNQSPYAQQQGMTPKQSKTKKNTVSLKSKKKEKKRISRPLVKRQSNVKLTVIEGKKNKKKNRALF